VTSGFGDTVAEVASSELASQKNTARTSLRVPVARDGSTFNPSLRRGAGYRVGDKGDERTITSFIDALEYLKRMPSPKCRRPNEAGSWGIVTGIAWKDILIEGEE
jgi:hypothetical protein